jgi:hypothetical protein
MSTTAITKRTGLRRRFGSAAAAVGLALGLSVAGVMVAGPAQAACKYSLLDAGYYYSYAYANTADCSWQSRSLAQHGAQNTGWTSWTTQWSEAYADDGVSNSWTAANQFR